jgi:hypothetical protein
MFRVQALFQLVKITFEKIFTIIGSEGSRLVG